MVNNEKFENPDAIYRCAAFWGLNDLLEPEELKRQIRAFKEQGMGGAFLHPRGGMVTEYLSDSYFEAIRVCIEELDRLDMVAWLYDEDCHPSGFAGGKVIKTDPRFRIRFLVPVLSDAAELSPDENTIALFLLKDHAYERVRPDAVPTSGKMLSVSLRYGSKQPRFNLESYVDVGNKEAIDTFISITHEAYYKRFKDYFGKTIPAIFFDEMHFRRNQADTIPWTEGFELKFKQKYNYDLLDCLPDLFIHCEGCEKTRFHYWDLISSLFVEACSKNISRWCGEKGIACTGHFWEHNFPIPLDTGSVMPSYEYMQYPGIDILYISDNDSAEENYGNDFIVKEASSVANQLGKKRVLCEANGASGWGLNLEYQKRSVDWQLALGINLFCQHLSLYSMTGYRKRDYPGSLMDHQPWWEHFKIFEDYVGRLSYVLSQGKYQADVLVLHPSGTTWTTYGRLEKNEEIMQVSDSVKRLARNLDQSRIMFDFGDEIILSRHGKVEGRQFDVGAMRYRVVILPSMGVLRKEVFALLKEYLGNGGIILAAGRTPTLLEGEYSPEVVRFFKLPGIVLIENEKAALNAFLASLSVERLILRETSGKDLSSVYGHIREDGNVRTVFVCNLDMDETVRLEMRMDQPYFVELLNAENGEITPCDVYRNPVGGLYAAFTLGALNSALFLIHKSRCASVTAPKEKAFTERALELSGWAVKTEDPNAMNLQFCRASINHEPYGEVDDVLAIDDTFKDRMGMERAIIFSRQPWMYTEEERNQTCFVRAEYPFTVGSVPSGRLMAAVELPKVFYVFINDVQVFPLEQYYKDRAFVLCDIKPYIKTGENILRVQSDRYGVMVSLENVYIVGDFKLSETAAGFSVGETDTLKTGNLVEQGYPYYSGKVSYTARVNIDSDFDQASLHLDRFHGVTAVVSINGKTLRPIGWKPYCADLTNDLKKGENTITVEIANSLQNLLGPFGSEADPDQVRPTSFYAKRHTQFLPVGFDGKALIRLIKSDKV